MYRFFQLGSAKFRLYTVTSSPRSRTHLFHRLFLPSHSRTVRCPFRVDHLAVVVAVVHSSAKAIRASKSHSTVADALQHRLLARQAILLSTPAMEMSSWVMDLQANFLDSEQMMSPTERVGSVSTMSLKGWKEEATSRSRSPPQVMTPPVSVSFLLSCPCLLVLRRRGYVFIPRMPEAL